MVIISVIAAFCIIILMDRSVLNKTDNKIKTSIIYYSILIVAFIISLLQVIGKAPTSPSYVIEEVVKSIIGGG